MLKILPFLLVFGLLGVSYFSCQKKFDDQNVEQFDSTRTITLSECNQQKGTTYSKSTNLVSAVGATALAPNVPAIKLPFPSGQSYSVDQSHGTGTHNSQPSYYAVDFLMPLCSEVVAVAAGRVMDVKENSARGGTAATYTNDTNYIIIDHGSGATGRYAHLCQNCALVSPGQLVDQGEVIALSGNTGWSTNPNLHFQMNDVSQNQSYLKNFEDVTSNGGIPSVGSSYTSANSRVTGSGQAFAGNESTIPTNFFASNNIESLTTSINWYNGLRKNVPITIAGTINPSSTDAYVQIGLFNSEGTYVDGVPVARSGNNFSVSFTPSSSLLTGNTYYFGILTKATANSVFQTTNTFAVYVGN